MEILYAPNTDFKPWSGEHSFWLMYALLSAVCWIYIGRNATEHQKQRIGLWMGLVGIVAWVWSVLVMILSDQVKAQSVVPLHLCYFLNLLLPIILWKKWLHWLDWIYPIVMAGCLQALFTPDLDQTFPHYYSVRYWLVHSALVQSMLYAIFVYQFRPTVKGIFKCMIGLNVYALIVTPVNLALDTNFLYLRNPAPGSIMEWFGPWPQYLIALELLMGVLFAVVYLPFGVANLLNKSVRNNERNGAGNW
jgi:hypothetical integral membrane protein (TIGR02206 family)